MPPPPKMDGENDGSVYSWGQIGNADIQGPVLPMLWGTHRVTGRIIQQYVSSVSDKQYLNLLVAVCEGPITSFADCKINGQLATSYRDVAVTTRVGTLYETVIDGFDQVITQHGYADRILFIGTGLTGIEDAASRPNAVIRTTDGNQVNAIEVEVGFPGGCYKIDHDGDNENLTINFCCGYRVHPSGGWVGPYGITVTGNGDNPVYGTHKMEGLPASSYDVLVYRTDYDNDGAAYQVDSYLTAIREFVDEEIQYRGVAKYAIQALATDQLSGGKPETTIIATRSSVWVYDEDSSAWVQKPATNPAWAGYDAIVKAREYTTWVITVTGSPVTDIHYDGFKSFAAQGDGLTPKVEINYYLDTDMDLWSLLM